MVFHGLWCAKVWWRCWVWSRVFVSGTLIRRQREDVEPCNTILCVYSLPKHTDVTAMMDNDAIYDVSRRIMGIEPSSHTILNRLLVHIISELTLNVDVTESQTNEVPHLHVVSNSVEPRSSCRSLSLRWRRDVRPAVSCTAGTWSREMSSQPWPPS